MSSFVSMYERLDRTMSTAEKQRVLAAWFGAAGDADLAWAVWVLSGRRVRRAVSGARLRDWAADHTGLPAWLIASCYHTVGDLSETLANLCAQGQGRVDVGLADFMERDIVPMEQRSDDEQRAVVMRWWRELDEPTCFIAHKLLGGAFRVGVSATMVARALASATGTAQSSVEHRLMGNWQPSATFGARLRDATSDNARSHPFPFYLATQLDEPAERLGPPEEWLAEWKWDGIRAQLIARGGEVFLWSRGEELVTERFPEIAAAAGALPGGTVLDGEIVIVREDRVQPFAVLQTRIGRKHIGPRLLRESPAVFIAFDVLEHGGADCRGLALRERRATLEALVGARGTLRVSERPPAATWEARAALRGESRRRGVEGLMLKRWSSPYRSGRPRGDWWKWKVDPYTADAVLVYAQSGSGKRAAQYTDYTFAVWDGAALVPVAKAYSGLDNEEIRRLDAWIRSHTTERFGPVRAVEPQQVFELGFEAIQYSSRHKAGIAVRFPRILRWRTDKAPGDANTLDDLRRLIAVAAEENPARRLAPPSAAPSLFDAPDV
jgi:DNA ligase-1